MTTNRRVLTDDELVQACRAKGDSGSRFVDTTLAEERRKVSDYYFGEAPVQTRDGGSKFTSQDVYLSVEAMKAEIVETFGAGSGIVTFAPQAADDIENARSGTAYCEFVVHRQNSGLEIFQDVVHDALTNRVGLAKVYWDRSEETAEYRFQDLPEEQVFELLRQPNARPTERPKAIVGPQGVVWSGAYEVVTDTSQVRIEPLPPEEFVITGRTRNLNKAPYLEHRYRETLGGLVEDGYDEALVYSIPTGEDDFDFDEEQLRREQNTTTGFIDDDAVDEAGRFVTVHESYIRIDAEGRGRQQLWRVVHAGGVLLDKQKVASHPFVAYVPQPIPHTFFGNNFAARTIPHANTKTVLVRAVIEQAVEATQPRWQIARGGVANPRELLDNRRGGIVNVRSIADSIAPLPSTPINPFVLQTISMVDQDREDTTSISRLSQGLDKKALSAQNSGDLVEQLTSNSQTRTKVIARNFALQFVAQLYLKVYALVIEHETRERQIEIAGRFTTLTPSQWASRRDVAVDMTLGYAERDERVAELTDLGRALRDDPLMKRSFGEQQAFNLWRDAMSIKGIRNMGDYMVDPSTLGPAQPDPMQAAELAKLQKDTEVAERQMALREAQVAEDAARKNAELEWKKLTGQHDMALKTAESARHDAETENRIDISLAELELAIDAAHSVEPKNEKFTAIASPNS